VGFLTETYQEQMQSLEKAFSEIRELKENLEDTAREIINVQEQERQRISYDLHDHIAQELSSLRMNCEIFLDDWPDAPQNIIDQKKYMSQRIKECINSVRNISYELRPPGLDEFGFSQVLHQYCREFAEENGLQLSFHSAGIENLNLDKSLKINLYRIMQEALSNIKKHAEAQTLTVKLLASHPNIMLRIEDDGKGFDYTTEQTPLVQKRKMGIQTMRDRTRLLNGIFEFRSQPGQGTKILVKIPTRGARYE
jgi:signal transduction histidine kinase